MSDAFRFETFVDAHSNIFNEYLGSVSADGVRMRHASPGGRDVVAR